MKIRASLIALAALAAMGSAQALTPAELTAEGGNVKVIRISGASALRMALGGYLQEIAAPNSLHVYWDSASGANHRAYAFRLNTAIAGFGAAGTPVLVTKRDAGGSGQGVTPLINADANQAHMLVNEACTLGTAGSTPSTDIGAANYICSATTPALLQAAINGGTGLDTSVLDAAGFVQNIFGVAVNRQLYLALQKAQGFVAGGVTTVDEDAAKQPTIPASFVRGVLTGQITGNGASKKGWNLLVPASVDAAINTKKVNICRRNAGSGTQAASNAYFANNPCNAANAYTVSSAAQAIGAVGAQGLASFPATGDVENCLGTTVDGIAGAYGLAILGRENNPLASVNGAVNDKRYRYVKLSGVAPERANAVNGSYELVFESSMQWPKATQTNAPSADKLAFLTNLRSNIGKASVLAKLDPDFQAGLAATPSTIPAGTAWSDLDDVTRSYTSHMTRTAAKSCTGLRMYK